MSKLNYLRRAEFESVCLKVFKGEIWNYISIRSKRHVMLKGF